MDGRKKIIARGATVLRMGQVSANLAQLNIQVGIHIWIEIGLPGLGVFKTKIFETETLGPTLLSHLKNVVFSPVRLLSKISHFLRQSRGASASDSVTRDVRPPSPAFLKDLDRCYASWAKKVILRTTVIRNLN